MWQGVGSSLWATFGRGLPEIVHLQHHHCVGACASVHAVGTAGNLDAMETVVCTWRNGICPWSLSSAHQAECSVCFCFHCPTDLFSPLQAAIALGCSAHLLSLREEQGRLCYLSLFHFITVDLEFRSQRAGAGLLFQYNHMSHVSSLV